MPPKVSPARPPRAPSTRMPTTTTSKSPQSTTTAPKRSPSSRNNTSTITSSSKAVTSSAARTLSTSQQRKASSTTTATATTSSTNKTAAPIYDTSLPHTCFISNTIPIMFTAPHGLELYRYKNKGTKRIVHRREIYTTELALRFAQRVAEILFETYTKMKPVVKVSEQSSTNKTTASSRIAPSTCSFCVWNCVTAKPLDPRNTDPNYTFKPDFEKSPWNAALRKFAAKVTEMNNNNNNTEQKSSTEKTEENNKQDDDRKKKDNSGDHFDRNNVQSDVDEKVEKETAKAASAVAAATSSTISSTPIGGIIPLHIDLHGKINRKDNFDLDVGADSFFHFQRAKHPRICMNLGTACRDLFPQAIKSCPVKLNNTMPATVECDPYLSGLWSDEIADDVPFTMTTQASLLEIPSFQLEFPKAMREAIVRSSMESMKFFEEMCVAFSKIFLSIQVLPPIVVLAKMFGQDNVKEAVPSRELVSQMLHDCLNFLQTEKSQI